MKQYRVARSSRTHEYRVERRDALKTLAPIMFFGTNWTKWASASLWRWSTQEEAQAELADLLTSQNGPETWDPV